MTSAPAAPPRLPLEELCRLPSLHHPRLSWAGDRLAYLWDGTGRLELYVADVASGERRQVSHGELPRAVKAGFAWARDGRSIVFARDAGGDEQHDLYRIEVPGGAVTRLTSDPAAQEYPVEFSPDGAWLTVLSNKRLPDAPDRPGQLNLWRVRPDGSDYQPLTRFASPVGGGRWSPDGGWIAFTTNEDGADLRNADAYVMRADGTGVRRVLSLRRGSREVAGEWHPDGRHLSVTSDASGVGQAGVLDLATGEVRWLSPAGVEETAGRFSPDGRTMLALRNHESQLRPVLYDLAGGEGRDLRLPPGVAAGGEFVPPGDHLLVGFSTDTARAGLVLYDLADDTWETLLAPEYGGIDPALFVPAAHVTYPSADGTPVPALLYLPRDTAAAGEDNGAPARHPAVVCVHGGPTSQWLRGFDATAQLLADRGFVVLQPNPRGSTGYGVAFRDAARLDWGGVDLEDVAAGAGYLAGLPQVDASRLVVFGGSYGGYMTFLAVTKRPDLWRAGVAWVGITDLRRLYDSSMEHFKYYLREQMGDPEAQATLWADRSAVTFAGQLEARLLIVHGVNDPRCPVEQARVFRDRLLAAGRQEGVDFEYIELPDEGHGTNDIEQRVRTCRILTDFLDRAV